MHPPGVTPRRVETGRRTAMTRDDVDRSDAGPPERSGQDFDEDCCCCCCETEESCTLEG